MSEHDALRPSAWVVRWAHLIEPGSRILDLACGRGRHARWFAERGCQVSAVDRDAEAIASLAGKKSLVAWQADLEQGPWPFAASEFDAIVVTNYLYRPRLASLSQALAADGVLIYETFMLGNEAFGRPRNPEFLLRDSELLEVFGATLATIGFEQGTIESPKPAVIQRYVGVRGDSARAVVLAK